MIIISSNHPINHVLCGHNLIKMNIQDQISTIMTTGITTVNPDQKLIDLKHIYEQAQYHSHVPVVENESLVGIVSLIDFMRAIQDATLDDNEEVYHELRVKDIMSLNPITIDHTKSIKDAATVLANGNFHSLLVMSEQKLAGIITTTDILKQLIK